jgi:hypothetical protein
MSCHQEAYKDLVSYDEHAQTYQAFAGSVSDGSSLLAYFVCLPGDHVRCCRSNSHSESQGIHGLCMGALGASYCWVVRVSSDLSGMAGTI